MNLTQKTKQLFLLFIFFTLAVTLWNSFILYPIKLFVVLLHELSHGLVVVLLGGKIESIQINSQMGGHIAYLMPSSSISKLLVASAGYLGSMFWGGLLLTLALKTNWDRYISLLIGIITLLLSFFVIKSGEIFGIFFCFSFSLLMILSYRYLSNFFHDLILKFIGLTSCLYVIIDIKSDLIDRTGIGSDADTISKIIWIPSIAIGAFWFLIAIFFLYKIFKWNFIYEKVKKN
ncbi:MAG: M50 family metallopeptidase [Oligoflexia bacterium]|nr:M50 family metallopeptidase [Oligoflexia bacterium]